MQTSAPFVFPAQAGIQNRTRSAHRFWIPACAGMTVRLTTNTVHHA